MRGLVENGFEVMITGVSSEGLTSEWLGRTLTLENLVELQSLAAKYRFHVDGEGGEYETLVIAGPHMVGQLDLHYKIEWDGIRGSLIFD